MNPCLFEQLHSFSMGFGRVDCVSQMYQRKQWFRKHIERTNKKSVDPQFLEEMHIMP